MITNRLSFIASTSLMAVATVFGQHQTVNGDLDVVGMISTNKNYRPIYLKHNGGNGVYGSEIGFNAILDTSVIPNEFVKLGGTSQVGGANIAVDQGGTMYFQLLDGASLGEVRVPFSPQIVFSNEGNVGIGAPPDARLSVGGVVKAGISYLNVAEVADCHTFLHGVKIQTNIPFVNGPMQSVIIEGYGYSPALSIGLSIGWHTWNGSHIASTASSWGGASPGVTLSNEGGLTTIHLDWLPYCPKFSVRAIGHGPTAWYEGWTVVDESIAGANLCVVPYRASAPGEFRFAEGIIASSGNVGIGTTTPQNKLDVNGTIRAKEVIVESAWADFVFEDGYPLMPLSAVERHIADQKRLPGVPSAADVARDGLSLAQSQATLLQKVEELTLYLIEKDKEVSALRAEMEQVKARLAGGAAQ